MGHTQHIAHAHRSQQGQFFRRKRSQALGHVQGGRRSHPSNGAASRHSDPTARLDRIERVDSEFFGAASGQTGIGEQHGVKQVAGNRIDARLCIVFWAGKFENVIGVIVARTIGQRLHAGLAQFNHIQRSDCATDQAEHALLARFQGCRQALHRDGDWACQLGIGQRCGQAQGLTVSADHCKVSAGGEVGNTFAHHDSISGVQRHAIGKGDGIGGLAVAGSQLVTFGPLALLHHQARRLLARLHTQIDHNRLGGHGVFSALRQLQAQARCIDHCVIGHVFLQGPGQQARQEHRRAGLQVQRGVEHQAGSLAVVARPVQGLGNGRGRSRAQHTHPQAVIGLGALKFVQGHFLQINAGRYAFLGTIGIENRTGHGAQHDVAPGLHRCAGPRTAARRDQAQIALGLGDVEAGASPCGQATRAVIAGQDIQRGIGRADAARCLQVDDAALDARRLGLAHIARQRGAGCDVACCDDRDIARHGTDQTHIHRAGIDALGQGHQANVALRLQAQRCGRCSGRAGQCDHVDTARGSRAHQAPNEGAFGAHNVLALQRDRSAGTAVQTAVVGDVAQAGDGNVRMVSAFHERQGHRFIGLHAEGVIVLATGHLDRSGVIGRFLQPAAAGFPLFIGEHGGAGALAFKSHRQA